MAISLEKYKQNKQDVIVNLEHLQTIFNNTFGGYEGIPETNTNLINRVDGFRESIQYILDDDRKTKEQEQKDREREEKIKQGIDVEKEERDAAAVAEMEDLEDELAGRQKKQRPQTGRYKTNEKELKDHLNKLEQLNTILKLPMKGKTVADFVMPNAEARQDMHNTMRSLDEKLGTNLAPKQTVGMYYDKYILDGFALDNIDKLKEKFNSPEYDKPENNEEKIEMVAAIFASRIAVGAGRNDKRTLNNTMDQEAFRKNYEKFLKSENFRRFVTTMPTDKIRSTLSGGHGGALEDKYIEFNQKQVNLPKDLLRRHQPTALNRIDYLKGLMKNKALSTEIKKDIITEILATRMAVGAVQNQKSSLKYPIKAEDVEKARQKIEANQTYKEIFNDPAKVAELEAALKKGHGGAVERCIQKHTAVAENFNEKNPEWLSPKKPPLPKSFAEAQAEVKKLAESKTPVNPHVMERQLLGAFYYANAENNPGLLPGTVHQNVEEKMNHIKEEGTFNYMMEKQGPQQMANHVMAGPLTTNSAFGTAKQTLTYQKNLAEMEASRNKLEVEGNQPENEQQGPIINNA